MSDALVIDGSALSWPGLRARAREVAVALAARGVEPGELLAVHLPSAAFAALFHAAPQLGAGLLVLNPRLAPGELAFQLEDAGVRWLLDAEASPAPLPPHPAWGRLRLDREGAWKRIDLPGKPATRGPGAGASVLYTSGTTGRPKGAVLSRAAFESGARAAATLLGASSRDRWLACMPLFHVGGIAILVRCAAAEAATIVHPRFDPERVSHALDREGVSHVSLVANMLERVLAVRGEARAPSSLRLVLVGGGPVPDDLIHRACALGYPVAPTYGLTEAASQVATRPPGRALGEGLHPLPGLEVEVVDELGRTAQPASEGEIRVRGGSLMDGYWRRPEATERALRDGWLYTGDIGRIGADGTLHVLDRRSDLIVSGGENVYPAEVEAVLVSHPRVGEAGVAGRPDERFGMRPHAWFVGRATPDELRHFCEARLARYKVPVGFERVEALPRGPAGKLLRSRLGA